MTQNTLFPVTVRNLIPTPFNTADLQFIAQGDDSQDYAVKSATPQQPELPAAEFLSYQLASACGLAVPAFTILKMPDGTEAFGSRFEGNVTQFSLMSIPDRLASIQACGSHLSVLCALDIFLASADRHFDNALYRKSPFGGNWTILAMDFSRALWQGGFPNTPCTDVASIGNTASTIKLLKNYNFWDAPRSKIVAATLLSINDKQVAGWVSSLPASWQTQNVSSLPAWWASNMRSDRINELLTVL